MRAKTRLLCFSAMLPLGLLAACGTTATKPPDAPTITVGSGDYTVDVASAAKTITLRRRGDALLTFPADGFQLATAVSIDPRAIIDPYWFEPEDGVIKPRPLFDVTWRNLSAFTVTSSSPTEAVIALGFDDGSTATLTIDEAATGRFAGSLTPGTVAGGQQLAILRLRPRASSTEAFYGLGEWGDTVNHRGLLRPTQMEGELTLENSDNENHVPVPLLIGTRGWGLFVETRRNGAFDVARKADDLIEVSFGTPDSVGERASEPLRFHLFGAERPLDVTKLYYDVTGYPLLPAKWALGPWIWRDENKDQAQFLDDMEQIRDLDLATSALWIDRPYATAVESFDFLPSQFPAPQMAIDRAHDMGFRMALWHSPYLEPTAEPYLDVAKAKGYFVPQPGTLLNHWSAPIDLTNPDAYSWWQSLIHKYTDMGIEGFKLDYGEDVVVLLNARAVWKFFDGTDERTAHYDYVRLYHKVYEETLPKTGGYLLCRTGRWGDQANVSVIWPGDLDATFTKKGESITSGGKTVNGVGGFPASVSDGLSLGPSGFPFFASDTGGYIHSPPTKELFVRWAEQTALSTVMNVGDSSSETPWEFTADNGRDQQALDIYRIYSRLHMRLFPYEWTYAQNIAKDGRPITRALGLAYPELGVHPSDTYLFGDNLLVAPVVGAAQTTRDVVLPPGDWIDWWDGTLYSGGANGGAKVTIPAPLEKLPLLIRAGGIVPLLRPTIDSMSPTTFPDRCDSFATTPGALWVRIAATQKGDFTLYDGTVVKAGGDGTASFAPGTEYKFGATFELITTPMPTAVMLDGAALPVVNGAAALDTAASGWYWEAATGGTLWIKFPDGMHAVAWH